MSFKSGWKGASFFEESDTLQTVTDRGATTTKFITVAGISAELYNSKFLQKVYIGGYTINTITSYGVFMDSTNYPIGLVHRYLQDSATAKAVIIDTQNALTTDGAKLAVFYNQGVEKYHVDKDGNAMMRNSKFKGYTESAGDPSLAELPDNNDFCFHKNTSTSDLYLAFNSGGVIKKIALT